MMFWFEIIVSFYSVDKHILLATKRHKGHKIKKDQSNTEDLRAIAFVRLVAFRG